MSRLNLGRYEFESGSSAKFWSIEHVETDQYRATWGRIGSSPQGEKIYSESDAYDKIAEKKSKGYRLVEHRVVDITQRKKPARSEADEPSDFLEMLRKV